MKITWYEYCMWIRKYRNFRLTLNQRCEWAFERMPSISISHGQRDEYIDLSVRLDLINIGHYTISQYSAFFFPAYNYRLFDTTASSPHDDLFMIACWFECAAGSARLFIIMCDMHLESVVFLLCFTHCFLPLATNCTHLHSIKLPSRVATSNSRVILLFFFSFVHAALSIKQTSAAVTIYILIFFFKLMLIHMQCHTPPLKLLPCYWNISLELTVMWYVAGWLVRSLCSTLKTRLSPLLKLMPVHTLAVRPLCKWAYILPKPIHWNVLICKLNYIL